jgi:hypothetical protein
MAGFSHTPPRTLQSQLRMIGGRLSGNEAGVYVDRRTGNAKGHPDLPLAEVFSEYPVARHFVCPQRSIWGAISKTLLACILATLGRVGFARGGKLLPFLFTASSWNPQNFHNQQVLPIECPMPNSRARFHDPRRTKRYKGGTPPLDGKDFSMVRPERFELPTFWFVARRSIQLS